MITTIPNGAELHALLKPYRQADILELAGLSSVPFTTLLKIHNGRTPNPRINTVARLYPVLMEFKLSKAAA